MKKTPALITAALFTAAALAGCSTGEAADKDEAALQHVNQLKMDAEMNGQLDTVNLTPDAGTLEPKPIEGVEFENDWAEKQLRDYMTYLGANSLEGFSKESPERNIVAVTNPADGVVRFEVRDGDYEEQDWPIDFMAINFMLFTGCAAPDVDSVIVETSSGSDYATQNACH